MWACTSPPHTCVHLPIPRPGGPTRPAISPLPRSAGSLPIVGLTVSRVVRGWSAWISTHVNPPAEDMQGSFCFSAEGDPVDRLRQQLINDRYFKTLLAFRSPSGDGLKWVTAIDRQRGNHKQWVSSLIAYISMSYGVEPDTQCTDITRSCFLPHDSHCYLHPSFRTGTYHVNCPF